MHSTIFILVQKDDAKAKTVELDTKAKTEAKAKSDELKSTFKKQIKTLKLILCIEEFLKYSGLK